LSLYLKMTGVQGGDRASGNGDSFDSLFEWTEKTCCSAGMRKYQPEQKPDTLDFVFEHVVRCFSLLALRHYPKFTCCELIANLFWEPNKESFTCRQDEKEPDVQYNHHGIKRDNSLVEADAYGQPVPRQVEQKIKPFGHQGDFVDVLFEHVESYTCNEDMPDDRKTVRSAVPTVTPDRENDRGINSRIQHVYEQEDEIQLYFRPKRGKRRRGKGEF
jgi:hypothetical protein